jgi:hypothetical protein
MHVFRNFGCPDRICLVFVRRKGNPDYAAQKGAAVSIPLFSCAAKARQLFGSKGDSCKFFSKNASKTPLKKKKGLARDEPAPF